MQTFAALTRCPNPQQGLPGLGNNLKQGQPFAARIFRIELH